MIEQKRGGGRTHSKGPFTPRTSTRENRLKSTVSRSKTKVEGKQRHVKDTKKGSSTIIHSKVKRLCDKGIAQPAHCLQITPERREGKACPELSGWIRVHHEQHKGVKPRKLMM